LKPLDVVIFFALAVVVYLVLRAYLWRALLCLQPGSIEVGEDAPADTQLPDGLTATDQVLVREGFKRIGSHYERPRLHQALVSHDYAHPSEGTYATVYLGRDARPRLYFLTETEEGALVITANFHRPAREVPGRYSSGCLENLPVARVFKAHVRRLAAFGKPKNTEDLSERVRIGQAWFAGAGQWEVRQQNALGLLWTVGTLGMVGAVILAKQ
jgi:hypothetical protein